MSKLASQANKLINRCHASVSLLTFQQVHQLFYALKMSHFCAYQKCNSKVKRQVPRYLSQKKKNHLDKTLLNVPTFPYQKPQMNHLDSRKLYKVTTR